MDHLTEDEVVGFLDASLAPEDRRRVARHLVSGCAVCGAQIFARVPDGMFLPPGPRPDESVYDGAIDRAFRTACRAARRWKEDQERLSRGLSWVREKNGLLSELTPPQARTILPWIRVEILLQLSFEIRHRDPVRMLEFVRHAQEVADRIERTPYGPGFLSDLRVRAWAELANALRVNELYRHADAALWHAQELLEHGSGDLMLQARLDDIQGSLRKDQRRYAEAVAAIDAAHRPI